MKNSALSSLLGVVASVLIAPGALWSQSFIGNAMPQVGQSGVFAFWNFNAGSDATTGEYSPANLDPAFGSGTLAFSGTSHITIFAGSVTNLPATDPTETGRGVALAVQNGPGGLNNGSHLTFTLDLTNLTNLSFSYAAQRTATGFNSTAVSYSNDGGQSYITYTQIPTHESSMGTTSAAPASIRTVNMSDLSAEIANLSDVRVRLTFDGGSTTSDAGNNRFDNFQFVATVVPEPSIYAALLGLGVLGLALLRRYRGQ